VSELGKHGKAYARPQAEVALLAERDALGTSVGARGYTTLAQAGLLGEVLHLERGQVLLDLGAGRGWPGLYLARSSGCDLVMADLPAAALRTASARARELRIAAAAVQASGTQLPFRGETFDAAVNTDVL
jgi:cyclopropane fatty-acyl-phospholipid synthase-like methyltransferase